jgi:hypothetical protein
VGKNLATTTIACFLIVSTLRASITIAKRREKKERI